MVEAPVVTALALLSFLGWIALIALVVTRLVEATERRRLARVFAQIRVTDAIHGALGAIVAPRVDKRRGGRWRITMGLGPRELTRAGQLVEITRQALGQDDARVRIVFTPRVNGAVPGSR
jgi:hypothetical protein